MSRTGYIYEIKSIDKSITEIYIGSTWDMKDRLRLHYHKCYNKNTKDYNYTVYKYIRENGGWDNFEMTIIDSGECEDELELHCAEQFYIDMAGGIENLLNSRDAFLLPEEIRKRKDMSSHNNKKKNIETKRFPCEMCDKCFQTNCHLQRHIAGPRHQKKLSQNVVI